MIDFYSNCRDGKFTWYEVIIVETIQGFFLDKSVRGTNRDFINFRGLESAA